MKRSLILAVSVVMFAVQIVGVEAQSKPKAMSAVGAVKSVSADSLVVTVGAKDMTFTLDSTTKFVGKGLSTKSGGAPMKATEAVAPHDQVRVSYHDMSGTLHAAQVSITSKAAK
jgi:Domain of unknown function (DUF5666)